MPESGQHPPVGSLDEPGHQFPTLLQGRASNSNREDCISPLQGLTNIHTRFYVTLLLIAFQFRLENANVKQDESTILY
jgi:hypothetical protein